MNFYQNYLKYCALAGKSPSAVAVAAGSTKTSVTRWKQGSIPTDATLLKLADYLGVTMEQLTADEQDTLGTLSAVPQSGLRLIPLYESVSAGFGVIPQSIPVGTVPVNIHSQSEANDTICVRVQGDSMAPKIEDGDIIVVRKQTSIDSGRIGVFPVDGEDTVVKRIVYRYGESWVELHSLNVAYPVRRFEGHDALKVRVLGVVKQVIKIL